MLNPEKKRLKMRAILAENPERFIEVADKTLAFFTEQVEELCKENVVGILALSQHELDALIKEQCLAHLRKAYLAYT